MYLEHFGFRCAPFEMTPDPGFLYLSESHREGLATLTYGVRARKGFVMLTGEVGTGKTTLLHALLEQLDANTASAFLFNPTLEPLDFFRVLFDEYEIDTECRTKAEYLIALDRYLVRRLERNRETLLIIDEAQKLSPEMLEEVRLLSNLETPHSKLIQILLVGQPELSKNLERTELRQLRQRVALRHDLKPLDDRETQIYVEQRLRRAGFAGSGLFSPAALKNIYEVSGGVPRTINNLCDSALLVAFAHDRQIVDEGDIGEVARDLDLLRGTESQVEPESASGRLRFWRRARRG